ncbi:MAG: LysR family transcriptional regulator [Acetobacter sp.]|uniref:Transcriptional regulator n=1 Tax=Acidomonas methanolica NBRC 104435 TaxID=1231351 RepID=A0A023D637_ACIMT|nr:LysR family transcriptional regulator [Acidomonas methanolica]TCS19085.1 DNA-binding transcriptional LysR family regulator [Acidomonas methanolica]GAJ29617.1 transcriptional regulator [Acidomonas methanolica NBRC 104435]GBQ48513.1 transcriptional regulator [Acidomonas methanolica]GEL00693.1 LysR family transcriptional regulator [Acidomonas methanolica NBRC 104435]
MIDWQDIHYFSVLARAGSLSAAARELGVDHVTVGRRVSSLEKALALRLIERLPRSTTLTREGEAIASLATKITEQVQAIERRARGYAASPSETVRVSASPAVAARLIAPHVVNFHRDHPGVTLVLSGASHNVALNRGEAEIAVRLSRPEDPDLMIRRIGVMRFGLYATREVATKPPEEWTFIGYDPVLEHITQQAWLRTLLTGRSIVFQASDLFGQQEAARAGLGAVVLPRFMGDDDPALVRLPVEHTPPTRDMWLVTYPDLKRSPAIRAVMNFLAQIIGLGCPLISRLS